MIPFLKWPGGKRWLIANYAHIFPKTFKSYIEPFLGSGSVFFHLEPEHSLLGDSNPELINTYLSIKKNWKKVEKLLAIHQENHSTEYYYIVRDHDPSNGFERAARLIYLNRSCFNGIYRVNREGKFNVPIGTRSSILLKTDDFAEVSKVLSNADIREADFETLIRKAKKSDLIFADPPYALSNNSNGFVKYNQKLFSWEDQVRLANALVEAHRRGCHIIATNLNHPLIRKLYLQKGFKLEVANRFRPISANSSSRQQFSELLIIAYS